MALETTAGGLAVRKGSEPRQVEMANATLLGAACVLGTFSGTAWPYALDIGR